MTAERRPRLVVLTHLAPIRNADNAGQNYVTAQVDFWSKTHDVSCLLIPGRSARTQLDDSIVPTHVVPSAPPSIVKGLTTTVADRVLRSFPGVPNPDLMYDLWADSVCRRTLQEADVVLLQWQRPAGLAPALRTRCRNAQLVAVLHDVDSQAVARRLSQSTSARLRAKYRVQRLIATVAERFIMGFSDDVMVLSNKDAELLPHGRAKVHIISPPIAAPMKPERKPREGRIIFVAGARPENEDALRWLLDEVLPLTGGYVSPRQVYVVGRQSPEATSEFSSRGVNLLGFVDDLTAEYRIAAVAVVPLRLGAGVKFKTAEAILHRVPLVTTGVGAEGIPGLEGSPKIADSSAAFAHRLKRLLANPAQAQSEADDLYSVVKERMGRTAFERSMSNVANLACATRPPTKLSGTVEPDSAPLRSDWGGGRPSG